MKPLPRSVVSLAFAFCLALPVKASATAYDVPSISVVRTTQTSIVLEVQAGPSGAPSGFWLDWTDRATYDTDGWNGYLVYCSMAGTPTLNTWGASSFQLAPNQAVQVEVGDLFDEQGYIATWNGELDPGTEYVFRAFANGDGGGTQSPYSGDVFATTMSAPPEDCTYTQGYWKTHPAVWPVLGLTLGSVFYTNAQLQDILDTPASGNGLIFLAHQLIAAKLNQANGATIPASVLTAMADADALIGALVIPPVGAGYLDPAVASPLTEALDQFNNGYVGPGHCDTVPAEPSTWSRIKNRLNN